MLVSPCVSRRTRHRVGGPRAAARVLTRVATLAMAFELALAGVASAQQGLIAGYVTDKSNNQPIAGAQVVVQGTTLGALTDLSGHFRINGAKGASATVIARRIGYASKGVEKRNWEEHGEVRELPLTTSQPAHDEQLSPELVLVLPPEERAQALAALGPPVWPMPRLRVFALPTPVAQPPVAQPPVAQPPVEQPPVAHPPAPSIRRLVAARLVSLGVIFIAATVLTLTLSLVAHALRAP